MNVETFCEFYERVGFHIIESPSSYWLNLRSRIYVALPPHSIINPDVEEVNELIVRHRLLGAKYSSPANGTGVTGGIWMCDNKAYDLSSLKKRTRAHVRKGLKVCDCHEIDFDYLGREGLALNRETMARQGRDDPLFSNEKRWRRLTSAGKAVAGAQAWGALLDGQLAAYLITFQVDDVLCILYGMCHTSMLPHRPNHVLLYTLVTTSMARPDIRRVSGGPASIFDLPSLDQYKTSMGFKKEPAELVVVLHPWLRPMLLSRLGQGALAVTRRLHPKSDSLKRTAAILDIARASRPRSSQDAYAQGSETGEAGSAAKLERPDMLA